MITGLRLGNFKAFAETQDIPIRPLTLIFGPNSSGKSSIIHGLLLAKKIDFKNGGNCHEVEKGVDIGGFRQFVHGRDTKKQVSIVVETFHKEQDLDDYWRDTDTGANLPTISCLRTSKTIGMSSDGAPTVISMMVQADEKTLIEFKINEKSKKINVKEINLEHPVFEGLFSRGVKSVTPPSFYTRKNIKKHGKTTTFTEELDVEKYKKELEDFYQKVKKVATKEIRRATYNGVLEHPDTYIEEFPTDPYESSYTEVRFVNSQDKEYCAILESLLKWLESFLYQIEHYYGGFSAQYLPPMRTIPGRHVAFSENSEGYDYSWHILLNDEKARNEVNKSLKTLGMNYRFDVRRREMIDPDKLEGLFSNYPASKTGKKKQVSFMQNLIRETRVRPMEKDIVLFDNRNVEVSLCDVGYGISQVVPVIMKACTSNRNIICIEQPEIHLHPKLQAELGDVFIESAINQKNTFVLETHSEHLILRILKRIRQTTKGNPHNGISIRPSDVSVLYVEPKGSFSIVRKLEFDENGNFIDEWPGGFFEESFNEIFSD